MITNEQYMQIMSEEYDLSNYYMKKKILFCNEASKESNIARIVTKLYDHIRRRITDIDFGTIPKSKGRIDQVENFKDLIDCLNNINSLVKTYKDPTNTVREIYSAIDNIKSREREFVKAFTLNIEFPIILYNMTVLSIISATSLVITASIEFIKNGSSSFTASFDKFGYNRTKDHVLFEYLTQFNNNCASGVVDKIIDSCIKNNIKATNESADLQYINESFDVLGFTQQMLKPFSYGQILLNLPSPFKLIAIIIAIGIAGYMLIKLLSKLIWFWLSFRVKVSDWFMAQAYFLEINAENLRFRENENNSNTEKIYQKQIALVNKFKKISNFFAIKDSKAKKDTENEEEPKQDVNNRDKNQYTAYQNTQKISHNLF